MQGGGWLSTKSKARSGAGGVSRIDHSMDRRIRLQRARRGWNECSWFLLGSSTGLRERDDRLLLLGRQPHRIRRSVSTRRTVIRPSSGQTVHPRCRMRIVHIHADIEVLTGRPTPGMAFTFLRRLLLGGISLQTQGDLVHRGSGTVRIKRRHRAL